MDRLESGYPAYAGIDPLLIIDNRYPSWLPRIRGDRPVIFPAGVGVFRATPHTRGSTCRHDLPGDYGGGYPAYAGIDPLSSGISKLFCRLPRIRGDRPYSTRWYNPKCGATPHTRGSTPSRKHTGRQLPGYPAYAGIDPELSVCCPGINRLPRIRGDRPCCRGLLSPLIKATPHTRGSTPLGSSCAHILGGYPAYAGIDLTLLLQVGMTRGYPAYAGIDPMPGIYAPCPPRLPRIRGDRPYTRKV